MVMDDELSCQTAGNPNTIPVKVLLVEDAPALQQLLSIQLDSVGYPHSIASDAEEALKLIAQANFDLILMDCNLPGMSGFQATQEIRKQEITTAGHVPIIAMTALSMAGDEEKCRAAGMDDYLSKPFTLADLRRKLQTWLPIDKSTESPNRTNPLSQ